MYGQDVECHAHIIKSGTHTDMHDLDIDAPHAMMISRTFAFNSLDSMRCAGGPDVSLRRVLNIDLVQLVRFTALSSVLRPKFAAAEPQLASIAGDWCRDMLEASR